MITENSQDNGLFQPSLGQRLKLSREQAGMTPEVVARRLRTPTVIVEAMEREDWARLGAPIYVRSHLLAYLDVLGLPSSLADLPESRPAVSRLAPMSSRSRLHGVFEKGMRNAIYLAMTTAIAVPAFWLIADFEGPRLLADAINLEADVATPARSEPVSAPSVTPREQPVAETSVPSDIPLASTPSQTSTENARVAGTVVASLTPFTQPSSESTTPETLSDAAELSGLRLLFREDSWFEVVTRDGRRIERDLVRAGSERQLPVGEDLQVTLGNAGAVEVRRNADLLDLTPYRSANVARFAVSSTSDVSAIVN